MRFVIALLIGFFITASNAQAANGPASLLVVGASTTPTHFNIEIGQPVQVYIIGATSEPLPDMMPVWIKNFNGNVPLVATRLTGLNISSFSYTPPLTGPGQSGVCNTSIVSYITVGHNTDNDLIDDGMQNHSSHAAAGLRYMFNGVPANCPVPVEPTTWSGLKLRLQ